MASYAGDHTQTLPGTMPGTAGIAVVVQGTREGIRRTQGPSSANDSVFACPDDRGYSDPKPFHQTARFDYGSYNFNGVQIPGAPNVAGATLGSLVEPKRTRC